MRNIRTMLTLVHHGEPLGSLKLVAQPMDRAEVLHTPRYDINGSWKNTPGENELVLSSENSTFPKLAIGGEPSTGFPPGGLVEPAGILDYSELPRPI